MTASSNNSFTIFSAFFQQGFTIPAIPYIHPIQAGKALANFDLGIEGDNTGINISEWNPNFSELTVAYYIWKNHTAQQLPFWGLCHYRRYFYSPAYSIPFKREYIFKDHSKAFKKVFTDKPQKEIETNLLAGKVISPVPYKYIKLKKCSIKIQYIKDHDAESWNLMEQALLKLYPDYKDAFNQLSSGITCSLYNMLIASWGFWDGYLHFLFNILLEVKKDLIPSKDAGQIRIFGNLSERLLYTYLIHHKNHNNLEIHYMPLAKLM